MVKVFRLVQPGLNPDVELHAALADRDCPAVATLRGWIETDHPTGPGGELTTLAMAQEFLAGAADGWAMATASVLRAPSCSASVAPVTRSVGFRADGSFPPPGTS